MVVGADVTHPNSDRKDIQKSIAAVVASISPDLMQYVAVLRQQENKAAKDKGTAREYIDEMEAIFIDILKVRKAWNFYGNILYNQAFGKHNNDRLPSKIFFYRDGVSEGQFQSVLLSELGAIQRACTNMRPGYEPGITFIIVQKRHHIRFNPTIGQ